MGRSVTENNGAVVVHEGGIYVHANYGSIYNGLSEEDVQRFIAPLQAQIDDFPNKIRDAVLNFSADLINEAVRRNIQPKTFEDAVSEPSFVLSFAEACKGHAKRNDETLETTLVQLLLSMVESKGNGIKQLTLEECIETATRLSAPHLAFLGLLMVLGQYGFYFSSSHAGSNFTNLYEKVYRPLFISVANLTEADIKHLLYLGCITKGNQQVDLKRVMVEKYLCVFLRDTPRELIGQYDGKPLYEVAPSLFATSRQNPNRMRLDCMNRTQLREGASKYNKEPGFLRAINEELTRELLSQPEIDAFLATIDSDWMQHATHFADICHAYPSPTNVGAVLGTMYLYNACYIDYEPEDALGLPSSRKTSMDRLKKVSEYWHPMPKTE